MRSPHENASHRTLRVFAGTPQEPMSGFGSRRWTDWSCTVGVSVTNRSALLSAVHVVRDLMREVDLAASRFRTGSELTRVNWLAGVPVPVSRTLTELVGTALDAAAETDGAVDPTVGLDLMAAGYDRDIRLVGDGAAAAPWPRRRADWSEVWLDRERGLLRVPRGLALDLGATAKAWTADRAVARVAQRFDTAALVEIGGDLAVAGAPEGGWRVHVAEREGELGQDIGVHAGGVATSTTTVRAWQRDGQPMHHLIDPRTGKPSRGPWRTVTVAEESALAANTASTAALVLGDAAEPWLINRGAPARLVHRDGTVVHLGDWPVEGIEAA
jgi:FAD:protein FMN transferase